MLSSTLKLFTALVLLQHCTTSICRPVSGPKQNNISNKSCSLNSFTTIHGDGAGVWPYLEYKSSDEKPPKFSINQTGEQLSSGYIFFGPENAGQTPGLKQQSPLIMSSKGDLIWAGPTGPSSNFRKQMLNGDPVLTFWEGTGAAASSGMDGHGYGSVKILDSKYRTIHTICPKGLNIKLPPGLNASCVADVHEQYITPNNTILITSYNITQANLSTIGGPEHGWVLDPLAVEIDINTNEPLWIWSPLEHVPIDSTHYPLLDAGQNSSNPYDWFHMNSIQSHGEKFLINARQTWGTYYVERSGDILWQLDGATGGDFGSLPDNGHFSWQHDARIQDHGDGQLLLTYFADNNGLPIYSYPSVGLGLILDQTPNKTNPPKLYSQLIDNEHSVYSYAEGSYTILNDGTSFLGYGVIPVMKEFSSTGDVTWSAQFGYINLNNTASSYRAYKYAWQATPQSEISLVVEKAESGDNLAHCAGQSNQRGFVSWNGATEVTTYDIYVGQDQNDLEKVATFEKKGFETEFVVPAHARYVRVVAIGLARDKAIGKSAIIAVD